MKKKLIRRALALAGAASLCLLCASPAFAADFDGPLREIRLSAEEGNGYYSSRIGKTEGDWQDSVLLKEGESLDFVCESTYTVSEVGQPTYGMQSVLQYATESEDGSTYSLTFKGPVILAASEDTVVFGKFVPGSEVRQTARFSNVRLGSDSTVKNIQGQEYVEPEILADVEIEITGTLQAVAELPAPEAVMVNGQLLFPDEASATRYREQAQDALDTPSAQLASPIQATYHHSSSGSRWFGGGYVLHEQEQLTWFFPVADVHNTQEETVVTEAGWEYGTNSSSLLGLPGYVPFEQYGAVELIGTDWLPTGLSRSSSTAGRAAATTAGATALGLGGGAVLNGLSSVLENTPFAKRREDYEDPDLAGDTPDLPEEDTPSVSVSFYRPFDDMVNTKGAAVDIHLTVNGGEGLRWHYVPTAICPEGLKAVVPAVVGGSHEATLVLNLTGAKMKKPHIPVFITVVAWAFDEGGRLLKTTGALELQLHRPGLEAERTADGALKVTLYTDGNLDGIAEKVALKPEQYTCTEAAGGTLLIEAKPPYKGSCRIAADEQEG